YCPQHQGNIAFINPAGWNEPRHRVVHASLIEGVTPANPTPPPPGTGAQGLIPPQPVAPPPSRKVAPPVVGPPPGNGGGIGGNGGGTGNVGPTQPMEPGIITLAP